MENKLKFSFVPNHTQKRSSNPRHSKKPTLTNFSESKVAAGVVTSLCMRRHPSLRCGTSFRKFSIALTLVGAGYLLFAGAVENALTDSDRYAIAKLGPLPQCQDIRSFQDEVSCASAVQQSLRTLLPVNRCPKVDASLSVEPANFIARGYGCCYSRARFTEKALNYYGFKTRHVAFHADGPFGIPGFLMPSTASHASSEVLTSRGWMGVDSNEPFILLTQSGQPVTFKNYKERLGELQQHPQPANFYQHELSVVYGLYSRHGMFYGRPLPSPEFNLGELIYYFK